MYSVNFFGGNNILFSRSQLAFTTKKHEYFKTFLKWRVFGPIIHCVLKVTSNTFYKGECVTFKSNTFYKGEYITF